MQLPSPFTINAAPRDAAQWSPDYRSWHMEGPALRDYIRVIRQHWLIIACCFLGAVAIMSLAVCWMTPLYTARSTILIEPQTPEVLALRQPLTNGEADYVDPNKFYRTQEDILKSRSLAARVILALHLQRNPFFNSEISSPGKLDAESSSIQPTAGPGDPGVRQAAAYSVVSDALETYLDNLDIILKPGTRLVTVAFTAPNPALSAKIVNAHIREYIARGVELRAQASASAVRFLKSRLGALRGNVEKAEEALNKYRAQRGIIAESPDDKAKLIIDRLSELSRELTAVQAKRIDLEAQVHLLNAANYGSLPEVLNEPTIQVLSEQLATIDSQYASLASEYKPDYPPLANLAAKRHKLEVRLKYEMRHIANSIQLKYQMAVAREKSLREEIEREKKSALALNDASLQDSILARAVETNRELYKHVLARMNELGIAAAVSDSNVSIVDYAQPPQRPSSPKKPFDIAFAGIFGLFLGVVLSFAIEHFDDGIKDPEEIQSILGLPSLGLVPNFAQLSTPRSLVSHYLGSSKSSRATDVSVPERNAELIVNVDSLSSASEAYRAVRLGLLFSQAEERPKVIMVTSASAKEGKTVTTINTGIAFAQMGERVLLVDADLRRPRCHMALDLPNQRGLAEILTGQAALENIIRPTHINGLFCIPAGSPSPNPAALLASKTMTALLSQLRQYYDCILIDSAPVLPVTDSLLLGSSADGVLLVASPDTSKQDVRRACAMLTQARANIFGVLLNRYPVNSSYYRHYYHYSSAQYTRAEEAQS